MDTVGRSQHTPIAVLLAVIAFACLGALTVSLAVYGALVRDYNCHILAGVILSYLVPWSAIFQWSKASKAEKANRFLLTTASITLAVGFLELLVLAKVIDFRITLSTPEIEPWRNPSHLWDPKLLHINKPHARSVWEGIEYRYDQYGFRNESDLDIADILVMGDSMIEGPRVAAADLITAHLARRLRRSVANLGQSWYGPQQELEVIQRYASRLHPHTCVWTFFEGNDLGDVQRYKEATKDWEAFSKDFHSFRHRSFIKNAVLAVRRIIDSILRRVLDSIYGDSHNQAQKSQSGIFLGADGRKIRIYFVAAAVPLSEADKETLQQVRASLAKAYEVCHAMSARFLVVFAPIKFRVYKNFTEFADNALPRDWVLNDLPKEIEAIVHEELPEGEFLDLTQAFVRQAKDGILVYFSGWDTHWSPEGHRVAATAIADVITRWELAGASARRP